MKFARDLLANPFIRSALVVVGIPISFFGVAISIYGAQTSASMLGVTIPSVQAMRSTYQADLWISIGILAGFAGFWGRIFVPTAWLGEHHVTRLLLLILLLAGCAAVVATLVRRSLPGHGPLNALDVITIAMGAVWLVLALASINIPTIFRAPDATRERKWASSRLAVLCLVATIAWLVVVRDWINWAAFTWMLTIDVSEKIAAFGALHVAFFAAVAATVGLLAGVPVRKSAVTLLVLMTFLELLWRGFWPPAGFARTLLETAVIGMIAGVLFGAAIARLLRGVIAPVPSPQPPLNDA